MVEKGIRGGIFIPFINMQNLITKKSKIMQKKNTQSLYIQYYDGNNLYARAMSQELPVNNFEWIKENSQFNEDFKKTYNGKSGERYFLEVNVQYLEKSHELHNDLPYLSEKVKTGKAGKFVANLHNKTEYFIHMAKNIY